MTIRREYIHQNGHLGVYANRSSKSAVPSASPAEAASNSPKKATKVEMIFGLRILDARFLLPVLVQTNGFLRPERILSKP